MRPVSDPRHFDGTPMYIGDLAFDRKIRRSFNLLGINAEVIKVNDSHFDKMFKFYRKNYSPIESRALSYLSTIVFFSKTIYGRNFDRAKSLAIYHLFYV
jgi:hypothetical protein